MRFHVEKNKMLQAGVLKPVHEATPWVNSFVCVESKDKLGNLKLCICLDPTNLNKAIIREPYHFRTPEDIAHTTQQISSTLREPPIYLLLVIPVDSQWCASLCQ